MLKTTVFTTQGPTASIVLTESRNEEGKAKKQIFQCWLD